MDSILPILLLIVVVALVISIKNTLSSKFALLQHKIDFLTDELLKLRKKEGLITPEESKTEKRPITSEEIIQHRIVDKPIPVKEEKPPVVEKVPELIKEPIKKPEVIISHETVIEAPLKTQAAKVVVPQKPPAVPKPKKPGFFERNPDLEKFIGENLVNKIGIGILVLGIGIFVKYAIDQDWIGPIGRVLIGIACGGILIGVAHYMRKTFAAFSSVLVGGGIAVLYLTIYIAFDKYQIFSQTAAFILMLVITGFTVVLSLGYNRIELAVLSILGGFSAPFLVSTGEGNYVVLFTYILLLDSGMLVLAYFKKWNLVNIISFVLTVLLFSVWLGAQFDGENISMVHGAITFATLFYLVFFAMNIVNNLRQGVTFGGLEIGLVLGNTFLYYAAGMAILSNSHTEDFKGLFTAALAIFNFIFAFTLYRNKNVDKNLVFLLIGLVLTFISLAAPIQLKGNYITLFWACETVLLLWLSQKSGIRLMKLASVIIMVLMVISLMMDWEQIYLRPDGESALNIIFNKGYITGLFAVVSVALTLLLVKNEKDGEYAVYFSAYKILLTVGGIVLLYTSQFLEIQYQVFEYFGSDTATQNILIGCYNMAFILLLLFTVDKLGLPEHITELIPVAGVLGMLSYLLFYQEQSVIVRNDYLLNTIGATGFVAHYFLIAILLVVSVVTLAGVRKLRAFNLQTKNAYAWFFVFFYLFIASAELDHAVMLIGFTDADSLYHVISQNHKIGYPILWGLASFLLIALGFKNKLKHLRIISLTLFLITLLKLFIFDISDISEGGKIAAFISLGILLLVVSFMYQRLKKMLLADEAAAEKNTTEPEKP